MYKGITRLFTVPAFDANRSLVAVFPTVTVDASGNLTQVNWEYHDRSGNRLSGPPSFMSGLRLQVQMNRGGSNQPESGDLSPTVTSFNFAANSMTPPFSSTFRFAIVRPRPVPVALVEKYGSNKCASAAWE